MVILPALWITLVSITLHSQKTTFQSADSSHVWTITTSGQSVGAISIVQSSKMRWTRRRSWWLRQQPFLLRIRVFGLVVRVRMKTHVHRQKTLEMTMWRRVIMVLRTWNVSLQNFQSGHVSLTTNTRTAWKCGEVLLVSMDVILIMYWRTLVVVTLTICLGRNLMRLHQLRRVEMR